MISASHKRKLIGACYREVLTIHHQLLTQLYSLPQIMHTHADVKQPQSSLGVLEFPNHVWCAFYHQVPSVPYLILIHTC